ERAAIARAPRRILDQRLTDIEAGRLVPESEAGCDLRPRRVVDRVTRSTIDEQRDHGAKNELIGKATDLRVVVEHDTRGARLRRQVTRHVPLVGRLERRRHSLDERPRTSVRGQLYRYPLSGSVARTGCRPWSTTCSARDRS